MHTYSYLIGNAVLLLMWGFLFWLRKDVRREMLFISIPFGFAGLLSEYIYTIDWWRPLTITGTRIGIEDFMFGFWVGGVSAVIYEEIFKKRIYIRKARAEKTFVLTLKMGLILALFFGGSFFIFGINSFYSSIIAFVPGILFIWTKRPDLIFDSLASGALLCLVGFLWFWVPEYITPGWVKNYWLLQNLSGVIILKAPLEDLIWGLLAGAYIGPIYEFWKGARVVNIDNITK